MDNGDLLNEFEDFGLAPNQKVLIKCKCFLLNFAIVKYKYRLIGCRERLICENLAID